LVSAPGIGGDDRFVSGERALEDLRLETLGSLLPGLIHEINNPLSAILGTIEFVNEIGGDAESVKTQLHRIQDCALEIRGTSKLVSNFVSEPLERRRLVFDALVEESVHLAQTVVVSRAIEITTQYKAGDDTFVEIVPNAVKQAILGLLLWAPGSGFTASAVDISTFVEAGEAS
jgi:signal transduction histidine kinase